MSNSEENTSRLLIICWTDYENSQGNIKKKTQENYGILREFSVGNQLDTLCKGKFRIAVRLLDILSYTKRSYILII